VGEFDGQPLGGFRDITPRMSDILRGAIFEAISIMRA